ncbi:hypothetical protein [Alienimonas chondri]|uniref:Uncharacterized protein n=1 Tax=Alienimonas chondri TaxID=2681879 RepID=A0ABX1VM80_9PLAN|nr:hypothetical protein [Alienimonas chondri]NNJ28037.1 hypothetical protein [Alienimonas chondri]
MSRSAPHPAVWAVAALVAASFAWPETAFGQDDLGAPTEALPEFDESAESQFEAPADPPGNNQEQPVLTPEQAAPEIAGAESTESVLRCAYRPHPTRVRAIYQFLSEHAAPGVDVSLRPIDRPASEPLRQVTRMQEQEVVSADGERRRVARPITTTVDGQGQTVAMELIIVAPPETQRAIGQFFRLSLSSDPAPTGPPVPSSDETFQPFGGSYQDSLPLDDSVPGDYGTSTPRKPSPRDAFSVFGGDPEVIGRPGDGSFAEDLPRDDVGFGDSPGSVPRRPVGDPFDDAFEE